MIRINLLSEGKRAAVRKTKPAGGLKLEGQDVGQWMLAAGIILGLAALGGAWWLLDRQVEQKRAEVAAAEREVEALASVIKEVEDYKEKKSELERKIGIINDLKANQRGPVRVMDHISRALPELLWLDRMRMTSSVIEIEGRAFNTNAVANFIENLDKVPEFEEPTLKDTQEQAGGIYKFVINFTYSFAPRAPEGAEQTASGDAGGVRPTSGQGGLPDGAQDRS
ncbi:MAG TPA: PilN domain-containing protein [Thermoanaerobaculia bacterium]|nr:PilN domain-containing protein [Thermoanaerobaculia bacterium]